MQLPIRLGLIGAGGVVQSLHVRAYQTIPYHVRVAAIADPLPEHRDKLGDTFGVPSQQRYADYRDMLAKAEIDAVTVATPHNLHREHVVESAAAGKAVISEKPMATSIEEADAIMEAVRANQVAYTVTMNYLYSPAIKTAKKLLASDSVGAPLFGRVQGMGRNDEVLARGREVQPDRIIWRMTKARGGGCISDSAYHEIYSLIELMGSPVRYVQAQVRTMLLPVDVDDLVILLCEHANGAISTVNSAWSASALPTLGGQRARGGTELHTRNAILSVQHRHSDVYVEYRSDVDHMRFDNGPEVKPQLIPVPKEESERYEHAPHGEFFARTFEALAEGNELPVPAEHAYHIMAVVDGARRATSIRRAVEI